MRKVTCEVNQLHTYTCIMWKLRSKSRSEVIPPACAGRFVLRAWWTRALREVSSLLKEHDSGSVWLSLSSTHVDQTLDASHSACCTWASANYIIGLAAVCDWILLTHFLTLQWAADSTLQAIHPFWVSRLKVHTSRPAEDYGSLWAGSLSVLQTNSLIRSDSLASAQLPV